jgi:CRP-like cAMP-binding protein
LLIRVDGILSVCVDDQEVAEVGPGAIVGERALLEHGTRTASLRAITDCTVAVAAEELIDHDALARLAALHRREDEATR